MLFHLVQAELHSMHLIYCSIFRVVCLGSLGCPRRLYLYWGKLTVERVHLRTKASVELVMGDRVLLNVGFLRILTPFFILFVLWGGERKNISIVYSHMAIPLMLDVVPYTGRYNFGTQQAGSHTSKATYRIDSCFSGFLLCDA